GSEKLSLEEMQAFLEGAAPVVFAGHGRAARYACVERTLRQHDYGRHGRVGKGLLRKYVAKMTGVSRAQVARLIGGYLAKGEVQPRVYQRRKFASRYTSADIDLLAYVDRAHGTLSGPATRRILEREYHELGQAVFARLAQVSAAQIYRFRKTAAYRKGNTRYQPTRPTPALIGQRRKPQPEGRPGYLRVDTVHQGDHDGGKGLYHVNAVDEVTQWQVVGATAHILELWLIPLLESILAQFPFRRRGFHSDNGSEFINHTVEKLLNKLLIEQTKSRPRHSNDNGLVKSKNGAVIRKHIGFGPIASDQAALVDQFHREFLNPYVNFHRPCGVPEEIVAANGKSKRVYPRYRTPYEILRQLPEAETFLRPGLDWAELDRLAMPQSDTEAARDMQQAMRDLFATIRKRSA
ncbi:MAG: integrase, partial [Acidobacteriota bacterium]